MMNNDKISIITPCFNASRYIAKTIESVLTQTCKEWEMIVVDDGSTDDSVLVISDYVRRDDRIKLVQQENSGSAAARNKGIKLAKGRYITLLDADDIWKPNFLEEQKKYISEKNAVCVCALYEQIDENSNIIKHQHHIKEIITLEDMRVMNYVGCLTGMYDTKKYGKIFLHEELKSLRDDYAYWYDIAKLENVIYCNQKCLAEYRVSAESVTGHKLKLVLKQYRFYRTYLDERPAEAIKNLIIWGWSGIKKFM